MSFVEIMVGILTLVFEPGKYLVSEAGYFVSKVNSVKQTTSTVFAQIESGFNHLMRPMFYGSYHEIENLSNLSGEKDFILWLVTFVRRTHLEAIAK